MGNCLSPKPPPISAEEEELDNLPKNKKRKVRLSKAQKEVDAVLVHLKCPTKSVSNFLLFFTEMDSDGSGTIDLNEFIAFLELEPYTIPFLQRVFQTMDFNKVTIFLFVLRFVTTPWNSLTPPFHSLFSLPPSRSERHLDH